MLEHVASRFFVTKSCPIWVWDRALSEHTCRELRDRIPGTLHTAGYVESDHTLARELGSLLAKTVTLEPEDFAPVVTYGRSTTPVGWHFDQSFGGSQFKLFAFLNEPKQLDPLGPLRHAGTIFDRDARIGVAAATGTVVLFDIGIEHCGAEQPPDFEKYTIGVRPVFNVMEQRDGKARGRRT